MENSDQKIVDQALMGIKKEGFSVQTFPKNAKGKTLLHHAAIWGQAETMKKLIRMGADKTVRNNQGWTASRNLEWRLTRGRTGSLPYDKELLKMMDISLPWTTRVLNFLSR